MVFQLQCFEIAAGCSGLLYNVYKHTLSQALSTDERSEQTPLQFASGNSMLADVAFFSELGFMLLSFVCEIFSL